MSFKENIRVAIRIRPLFINGGEQAKIITNVTPGKPEVEIYTHRFTFDDVFDYETTQEQVYDKVVKPLINRCFEGYNATILAYGQTGSGKTHTMGTDFHLQNNQNGIIPRALEQFFANGSKINGQEFSYRLQFIEIYNEEIRDLLCESDRAQRQKVIQIIDAPKRGIVLQGVVQLAVKTVDEVLDVLKRGSLSRSTGATRMNQASSRSHAIFTLFIDRTDKQDTYAKFNFVDLAGSERLSRTGAKGERMKESIKINSSLLHLGNVISKLGDPSQKGSFVNYRDSKLTRILQDSIGGNSLTTMIACISPSEYDFTETLNTLRYANRAKNIKNHLFTNQDNGDELLCEMRKRNHDLKNENRSLIDRIKGFENRLQLYQAKIKCLSKFYDDINRETMQFKDKADRLELGENRAIFDDYFRAYSELCNQCSAADSCQFEFEFDHTARIMPAFNDHFNAVFSDGDDDDDLENACRNKLVDNADDDNEMDSTFEEQAQLKNYQQKFLKREHYLQTIISMIETKEKLIIDTEERQQRCHNQAKIYEKDIEMLREQIYSLQNERDDSIEKATFVSKDPKIAEMNEQITSLIEQLDEKVEEQNRIAASEASLNEQLKYMRLEVIEAKKMKVQLYYSMNMIQQKHIQTGKKCSSILETPRKVRQTWARCENRLDSYIKNKLQFEYEEEKLETYLKQRDELKREIESYEANPDSNNSKYYHDRKLNLEFVESCIEDCKNILTMLDVDVDWGEWCESMTNKEVNYVIHKLMRTSIDYALQSLRCEQEIHDKNEEIAFLRTNDTV